LDFLKLDVPLKDVFLSNNIGIYPTSSSRRLKIHLICPIIFFGILHRNFRKYRHCLALHSFETHLLMLHHPLVLGGNRSSSDKLAAILVFETPLIPVKIIPKSARDITFKSQSLDKFFEVFNDFSKISLLKNPNMDFCCKNIYKQRPPSP
jgi:hypothetical protein